MTLWWRHADWKYWNSTWGINTNAEWWWSNTTDIERDRKSKHHTWSTKQAGGNWITWTSKRTWTIHNQSRDVIRKNYIDNQWKRKLVADGKINGKRRFGGGKVNVLQIGLGTHKTIFDGRLAFLQEATSNTSNYLHSVCIEPVATLIKKYKRHLTWMPNVSLAEVAIGSECNNVAWYYVSMALHISAIRTNRT